MKEVSSVTPSISTSTEGTQQSSLQLLNLSDAEDSKRSVIGKCLKLVEDTESDNDYESNCTSSCFASCTENDSVDEEEDGRRMELLQRPSKRRRKHKVRFSVVHVREYSVTFGDHPLPDRFPLSLDWAHTTAKVIELDEYEMIRIKRQKHWRPLCHRFGHRCSCSVRKMRSKRRHGPHSLSAAERCVKLSMVGGLGPNELRQRERSRHEQLEKEILDLLVSDDDDNDDIYDDNDDSTKDWNAGDNIELEFENYKDAAQYVSDDDFE